MIIFDPITEYTQKYRDEYNAKVVEYFNDLVVRSGVDGERNRRTLKEYKSFCEKSDTLRKKLTWWRVLRVVLCITILLIPLVVIKINPIIKQLRSNIAHADESAKELMRKAREQMQPLNDLFTDRNSLDIIESVLPEITFFRSFTGKQEENMKKNFDFDNYVYDMESSTVDLLYGEFRGNPFLFDKTLNHRLSTKTYCGSLTIHWTTTTVDSEGRTSTVHHSETLHASVEKPCPYYSNKLVLYYGNQAAPDLRFSRTPKHVEGKSERAVKRLVRSGEKKLNKLSRKSIAHGGNFMSLANTEFEVLFGAWDRTHEVQYRTIFTPLAQTNMVDLLRSKIGYGDDFMFEKNERMNVICSEHSGIRPLWLTPYDYRSHSYDEIRTNFISKNTKLFNDVYFDFAPLWAIPAYQDRNVSVQSSSVWCVNKYGYKTYECLANIAPELCTKHPQSKTPAILKPSFESSDDGGDRIVVTASSYDIIKRVDYISVYGGDGYFHDVPVPWDEYVPLTARNEFCVTKTAHRRNGTVLAERNGVKLTYR